MVEGCTQTEAKVSYHDFAVGVNSSSYHNILLSFVNSIIVLRTEVTAYGLVVFGPTVEKVFLSKMWLL